MKTLPAFLLAALLLIPGVSAVSTTVTTQAASFVSFDSATLNGVLTDMGTQAVAPMVLGLAGAQATEPNAYSFLVNVPTGTGFVLYHTGRTSSTCGTLTTLTLDGNAATKVGSTLKVDGAGETAVELWYEEAPAVGAAKTLAATWTGTCSAGNRHVIAAIALSGVNEGSPFSGISLLDDGTTPDASLALSLGGSPGVGQIRSVMVSDTSSTGNGDMRFNDPSGVETFDWGWLHSLSGTTYCAAGNPACVEGGFTTGNSLSADTVGAPTFYWAYSGILVNGAEQPVTSVQVGFEYGTTVGFGSLTDLDTMTATGTFHVLLGGLQPETTYYFRAYAIGSGTVNGATMSFTTSFNPGNLFLLAAFLVFMVGGSSLLAAWRLKR